MHRLFESIKYKEGQCHLLPYHFNRMNASCMILYKTRIPYFSLLERELEAIQEEGLFKLRIHYDATSFQLQLEPYIQRGIRALQLVHDHDIDYSLKYTDREQLLELKSGHDEIMIVKQDELTDSSYSNLAFWNGAEWHTPLHPLLKGVQRQRLLDEGRMIEKKIQVNDLSRYQKVSLINAMLELDELTLDMIDVIR